MKFTEGFVSGFACFALIAMLIASNLDPNKAKEECEKDLARNLKCEMVYVKPEGI